MAFTPRLGVAAMGIVASLAIGLAGPADASQYRPSDYGSWNSGGSSGSSRDSTENDIVVKLERGQSIGDITRRFSLRVKETTLQSEGVYLVRPSNPGQVNMGALVRTISASPGVAYAEPNIQVQLMDTRFHSWPYGAPTQAAQSDYSSQSVIGYLGLSYTQNSGQGEGVSVAVLDTGVDRWHPALAGSLAQGYNYVDYNYDYADDADRVDSNGDGIIDGSLGHGTFVAGLVHLVAPKAKIIPVRVLDSDGSGDVFLIAQAIHEAAGRGADVINLSFGTETRIDSRLLKETIADVQSRGVVVVAAAGNNQNSSPHLPRFAARGGQCRGHRHQRIFPCRVLKLRAMGAGRCTRSKSGGSGPGQSLRTVVGYVDGGSAGRRASCPHRQG